MSNYTEGFTSVTGDTVDAAELEGEFDKIATAVNSKLDSDGTGTMSGDLNMGNNDITNVSDPSNAQDAATKNYVDTLIVMDSAEVATTTISTIETNEDEITLTIPSAWNGYYAVVNAAFNIQDAGSATADAVVELRIRQGSGVAGTAVAFATGGVGNNTPNTVVHLGLHGIDPGLTATGSVTWSLTSDITTQSNLYELRNCEWSVMAVRTS